MNDPARERILTAFDHELEASPLPPGLRERTIRAAVTSPREPARVLRPAAMMAVIALLVAVALVATLMLVHLRPAPVPAHSLIPPAPRSNAAIAYDQARGDMVLFGGLGGSAAPLDETWTWDGRYWTLEHSTVSPPASIGGVMAYDQRRHEVVLVAAAYGLNRPPETWTWNGSSWTQKHPAHILPFGYEWQGPTMQFDLLTHTVLLYGVVSGSHQAQTWSWNGSDWTQLDPADSPSGLGSMVFDGHQVLLLVPSANRVGGRYLTQTWAWDGTNWKVLSPKFNLPGPSSSAAYDAADGRLVVLANDTWTWDGSTWARQHPSLQPPTDGYMGYMPSLRKVVSWGSVADNTDGEMYAWDGTNWSLIQSGPHPEATGGKGGYPGWMTPDQAAAMVRSSVINTNPVLLPTSLPGGSWDASVASLGTDAFSITYASDQRDKTITFGAEVAQPPSGDPSSTDVYVKFRNALPLKFQKAGYAEYFVYDASAPFSQRWLMWIEPGSSSFTKEAGVWYFLSASGLTDQEFWQVANSLR